ncbi:MAG: sulfatase-like hydrolase/transferase, partial [Planctomycetes bacterium]|nr:sulfatase-like hydrolase/transferase [Planctomycetota bacterium]
GLGGVGTSGDPLAQGFDHFFGYNCQRHAHNYYPSYLIRDREKVMLEGNDGTSATGKQYAPDRMAEEALAFIQQNRARPFFLYFSTTVPHMALQVPEDSLAEYRGRFDDKPYDGKKGYQPHPAPRAAYAAMITRLDRDIGRMMQRLKELGLEDRTLVCFASDNGPTFNGGTDSAFFQSAGPLHGLKAQVYEGGIRVPLIARWPGRIPAGRVTDQVAAAWDVLPTVADIVGAAPPATIDGVSLLPTLQGQPGQRQHEYLYWESSGLQGGEQGLRWGDWKGVRTQIHKNPNAPLTLFNLKDDLGETRDLAREQPDVAAKVLQLMKAAHEPSPEFPFKELDS